MPKFDISSEELKNIKKEKKTDVSLAAPNLDAVNFGSFKTALDTFSQLSDIRANGSNLLKSLCDVSKMYSPPITPAMIRPPEVPNWQANIIDPLEKQLGAMQDLNISLAKQNLALQTQSELIQKQLAESQKANALKEKELEDGKKSRKIDRRWVVRSFLISLLTLIATLLFGYYSLNIKPQEQLPDEKLAPSENIIPLEKNEQSTKDTVESALKHKPDISLPTEDEVITKDATDKNTSE